MGLSIRDIEVGAIVDWEIEQRNYGKHAGVKTSEIPEGEEKQEVAREEIKRGIIVKVKGNGKDMVQGVWVKFSADGEPVKVRAGELVRVFPAKHRVAREAYRRIMNVPKYAGSRYLDQNRMAARPVQDALALTPIRDEEGLVKPEIGSVNEVPEEMGKMGLEDTPE